MNGLEQQLASLLTDAPGEPPNAIDPDALLAGAPRSRRYLAPTLAAAAVVAIAVPIAVFLVRDSGTTPVDNSPTAGSQAPAPPTAVADPKGDAIDRITAALDAAPLPPDAVRSDTELAPVKNGFTTSDSPNEVRQTAWWTAPGEVDAAISYLKAHPPAEMTKLATENGSGGDQGIEFETTPNDPAAYPVELDYDVAPYNGGIAVRIDSWTTWVADRPDWSFVPADATSVDVTVVRDSLNPDQPELGGAPTVERTLTGDELTQLADVINALPPRAPEGVHSCPAILVSARDTAVFHSPAGDIRIVRNMVGCAFNATITPPPGADEVYVNGSDFTDAVLAALGLPKDYGFGDH